MGKEKDKSKKKKDKKEKVTLIDDGRSIADMSSLGGGKGKNGQYRAPMREQFKTFRDAQRAMLLPMLAVLGIIALAFIVVYILL